MKGQTNIEQIYKEHSYAVYRRCRRLLGNEAEALDMTQEVFLQLMEHPERFRGRSAMATYLFSIATHLCLNRLRNTAARGEAWQQNVSRHITEHQRAGTLDSDIDAQHLVKALLQEADEQTATMVLYHYVDGLSQGEIGKLVGVSRVTVNQRLGAFRQQAQQLMEQRAS